MASTSLPAVAPSQASVDNVVCMPGMSKVTGQDQFLAPRSSFTRVRAASLSACVIASVLSLAFFVYGITQLARAAKTRNTAARAPAAVALLAALCIAAGAGVPAGIAYASAGQGTGIATFVGCAKAATLQQHG